MRDGSVSIGNANVFALLEDWIGSSKLGGLVFLGMML
jgi:hypothetical protein